MSRPRALVTTTDTARRRAALSALEDAGYDASAGEEGAGCVAQVRAERPDLLVLVAPLLWRSVAGLLAALHEDPLTCRVPVLIVDPSAGGGRLPRVPLSFPRRPAEPAPAAAVDRACSRPRGGARADVSPADGPPAP